MGTSNKLNNPKLVDLLTFDTFIIFNITGTSIRGKISNIEVTFLSDTTLECMFQNITFV